MASRRSTRNHRWVRWVAALGLVVMALGLWATAHALPRSDAKPPAPASFVPQAPRAGDHGEYTWQVVEDTENGLVSRQAEKTLLQFEWLESTLKGPLGTPGMVAGFDGRMHAADSVRTWMGGPQSDEMNTITEFHFERLLGHLVGRTDLVLLGTGDSLEFLRRSILSEEEPVPTPCLRLSSERSGFAGPCTLGPYRSDGGALRPVASDTYAGWPAVVFADDAYPPGSAYLWLSPDNAQVLRIAVARPDAPHVFDVLRLAGFEAGPESEPKAIPEPMSLPPIELLPAQPWGPADEGLKQPFPLAEAFQHARDDPLQPALRDFLAEHPTATTLEANHDPLFFTHHTASVTYAWEFVVGDGADRMLVNVKKTVRNAGPDSPLLDTYEYGRRSFVPPREDASYPTRQPALLPSWASLARVWSAYLAYESSEPRAVPSYFGFGDELPRTERIESQCLTCTAPTDYYVWVGRETRRDGAMGLDWIAARADGTLVETLTWQKGSLDGPDSAALTAGARVAPPLEDSPWSLPTLLGAMGFLTLLAGVVAIAWGQIKTLLVRGLVAIGLYSRVERDDALGHPIRQRIHHAVEQNPGIHFMDVVRLTGISQGQVQHHLGKLIHTGHVATTRSDYYTCYYIRGRHDHGAMTAASAVKAAGARAVLEIVVRRSRVSAQDVAREAGLDPSTVRYHAARLSAAGAVVLERVGGRLWLLASPRSRALAATTPHVLDGPVEA